jgi:hypothetical protein
MKYIKRYENRFTNIFKSSDSIKDDFSDILNRHGDEGFTPIMNAAENGNWKRFKYLLPSSRNEINNVHVMYLDDGTEAKENVLTWAIFGRGDLWEKKKMFSALIENGVNVLFENEDGLNFYDRLKSKKDKKYIELKEWIDEKYPNLIEEAKIKKDVNKYNL